MRSLLHELMVSQEELEIQNEQLRDAQAALEESRNRFHDLFDLAPVAYVELNPGGVVIEANRAAGELFGAHPCDLRGRPLSSRLQAEQVSLLLQERQRAIAARQPSRCEIELRFRSGGSAFVLLTTSVLHNTPMSFLCSLVDITQRRDAEKELSRLAKELELANVRLQELAMRDPLTRLLNRRGFEDNMERELERARREGSSLCALLIDCDDFKRVNDTLGHAAGDAVLITIAQRLTEALRPTDVLARVGGDEFLALLPDAGVAQAAHVAERLRLSIANDPVALSHGPLCLTISLAVAVVESGTASIEEILATCRKPLHDSKAHGKNRSSIDGAVHSLPGSESICKRFGDTIRAEGFFHAAIHPIVTTDAGRVFGYELLTRGPEGPLQHPQDLFRAAVEENLLTTVDVRCLRTCLGAVAAMPAHLWYHVNIYPSTLLDLRDERLLDLLSEGGLNADRVLCLELSEQQMLGDLAELRLITNALRARGVRIAIDDVGFGRSSLESLIVLEPEIVKIDRRHVSGACAETYRRKALERIVLAAEALGASVVAEGVENEDDLSLLCDLGVPYAQGFLWGQPELC